MTTYLQDTGIFRFRVTEWTFEQSTKAESQSACIVYKLDAVQKWHEDPGLPDGGQWSQEWQPGWTAFLRSYIIDRRGDANLGAIKALSEAGIFSGNLEDIEGPPPAAVFIAEMKLDSYNGRDSYRAEWPKANADVPKTAGGLRPADSNLLRSMNAKLGAQLRAATGGAQRAASPAPAPAPPAAPAPASNFSPDDTPF